jgi:hypothetical protein
MHVGPAVAEIVIHFAITVVAIVSIAGIQMLLSFLGLDGKRIPATEITLNDWMFYLELVTVTLILGTGLVKSIARLVQR